MLAANTHCNARRRPGAAAGRPHPPVPTTTHVARCPHLQVRRTAPSDGTPGSSEKPSCAQLPTPSVAHTCCAPGQRRAATAPPAPPPSARHG
eukprot:351948-Chlamydomonas_euryale.AAC.5